MIFGRCEPRYKAATPRALNAWIVSRTVWSSQPRWCAIAGARSPARSGGVAARTDQMSAGRPRPALARRPSADAQIWEKADEPAVTGLFRVGDIRHIFSGVEPLRRLGWRRTVSHRERVKEYLAWAVEQPDLDDTVGPALARMQRLGVVRPLVGTH
jgi:hypothetical protein